MGIIGRYWGIALIILLSFFAIKPFFASGFFPMHDDTQVARVFEMKQALSDGMFPVRWVPDLGYGYGYPIFNFYAPFAYYIGGFINLLGFDALIATKTMMVSGIILAGISMYLLAKEFWGEIGGIVSGFLYLYAPYHAVDIYVRGDVAEFFAYAFIPLVFLGIYKLFTLSKEHKHTKLISLFNLKNVLRIRKEIWFWVIITSISYAFIIISHNLTALMATPFIVAEVLILFMISILKKSENLFVIILSLLIGILLSSFYWLPVIPEMKYTNVLSVIGGGSNFKDHFVCPAQLWSSSWGFGGSAPGCIDGMSFMIGKIHIIFLVFSLISLYYFWKLNRKKFTIILFSIVSLALSIFLMFNQSLFVWHAIPQMAFFQFPWRFLILTTFFASFLSGSVIWILQTKIIKNSPKIFWVTSIVMIIAIIIYYSDVYIPQKILNKKASDYTNKYNLTWTTSKISDEYMVNGFHKPENANKIPKNKIIAAEDKVTISDLSAKTQSIHAKLNAKERTDIVINLAYFPAWYVFLDDKQIGFRYFDKGLIATIPQGTHTIDIKYIQTPIEKLGDYLSLTGVIILIVGIITQGKKLKYG